MLTTTYAYKANTRMVSTITLTNKAGETGGWAYTYDNNGNITAVKVTNPDGTTRTTKYTYDSANQLVREDNPKTGVTTVWTYDNAGNIKTRTEYVYTTGTPSETLDTVTYTYGNSNWGDLLTKYDGYSITYDSIGNPTSYYNGTRWAMTWEHGRQLATMSDTSTSTVWTNTYNSAGLRTKRTDGTTTYTYIYDGDRITGVKRNDLNMWIIYDENGPVTLKYGTGTFHYVTNLQGDVVAIVDKSGNSLVEYTYDAWGKVLSITGDYAYNLGIHNPILYRGYVYDHETGLYYCQSRYYDPETGRFLNADGYTSTSELLGNNMFAYCANNPVMYSDAKGESPLGTLELWDYYIIHKIVQVLCVAENDWDMEVYVKGPKGRGFLDLYDSDTNSYYEVKSKKASQRTFSLNRQMSKYDVSHIADKRYKDDNITDSPSRGTAYVSGTFAYGIWDINYKTEANGLIVYEPERNIDRTLGMAVTTIIILCLATGNVGVAAGLGYAFAPAG